MKAHDPFVTVYGSVCDGSTEADGFFTRTVKGTAASGGSEEQPATDACPMLLVYGEWTPPFLSMTVCDPDNLLLSFTRDDDGSGLLHIESRGHSGSVAHIAVPIGDLSLADPKYFEPRSERSLGEIEVACHPGGAVVRLDGERHYYIRNGAIVTDSWVPVR